MFRNLVVAAFFMLLQGAAARGDTAGGARLLQATPPPEETDATPMPSAMATTLAPSVSQAPAADSSESAAPSSLQTTAAPSISLAPSTAVLPGADNNPDWICGCEFCDDSVLGAVTDVIDGNNITCGDRIDYVKGQGVEDSEACSLIGNQFPDTCARCNPEVCATLSPDMGVTDDEPVDYFCDCGSCTDLVLNTTTDGNTTCGARIMFLIETGVNETESCMTVSGQFPAECGLCNPTNCTFDGEVETLESDAPSDVPSSFPTAVSMGPVAGQATEEPTFSPSLPLDSNETDRGDVSPSGSASTLVQVNVLVAALTVMLSSVITWQS